MKANVTGTITNTGAAVVGGIVAGFANKLPLNAKIANGIALVTGAVLPMLAPKSNFVRTMGAGVSAVAGQRLVAAFVPSIAGVCGISDDAVAGTLSDLSIAGINNRSQNPTVINGLQEEIDD